MTDDDLESRVSTLESEVSDLQKEVSTTKDIANRALSRSIDVATDFEGIQDSDDRLGEELSELKSTVRNLQAELASQASGIETWAAQLIQSMLNECDEYGSKQTAVDVKEALRTLQHEPDRTTIYDIFETAEGLADTDAVNHATEPHRLQVDVSKGDPPRTIGLHKIDVPDGICGGSTTTESGVGGQNTTETEQPVSTTIGTD